MSVLAQVSYGIDLSDGTLKAVRMSRSGRRLTVHRTWSLPYADARDPDAASLEALARLAQEARIGRSARVIVSAPTRGALTRTYVVPAVEVERVAELVRYEVLSELRDQEDDRLIRHRLRRGVVEHQAHTYALIRRRVDRFAAHLADRGFSYDDLEHPGFALGSYVETEAPSGDDRVLLGVGRLATELVLISEHGIWSRHVPIGIDADDAAGLARRLKAEVHAAIAFFLGEDRAFDPREVVLSEEGAADTALTEALSRQIGRPVVVFERPQRLRLAHRLRGREREVLAMGKAIGLALAGLGVGRFRCPVTGGNPARTATRQVPLAAGVAVFAAVALVGYSVWIGGRADALERALPADLPDRMHSVVDRLAAAEQQRASAARSAEAVLGIAARRGAAYQARRAVQAVMKLVEDRAGQQLHAEQVWVSTGGTSRAGELSILLRTRADERSGLAERIASTFREEFDEVAVRGPEPAPRAGESRYVVEVVLR